MPAIECVETCLTAAPHSPPGSRWSGDRGAIPGEPMYFLDIEDGDIDTAVAAIVEMEVPGRGVFYEAVRPGGNVLAQASTLKEAAILAERSIDEANEPDATELAVAEVQV